MRPSRLDGAVQDPPAPGSGNGALSDHDREILGLLGAENDIQVTFQGLRRSLDIHQESLSRALRRLRQEGLITETEQGYRLSHQGWDIARAVARPFDLPEIPVLRTVLPGEIEGRHAAEVLRHRWFGPLRWYGHASDERGVTLSWTTEDGGIRLDARFEGVLLAVDSRLSDPSRLPEAIVAAHRLLYEVNQAYLGALQRALPPPNS